MYAYDTYDQTIVNERVEQYRKQTQRYLAGEITEDEFRPLRLMNGLYIQTHAPMLRIAVPYGLLSSKQLRKLGDIARKYDKSYGHFSTRQNLQLNWPELEKVPDILQELASVEMHAIQTSGNCIRNITTDQYAGVAPDELEDPRPYCEIMRHWSTFHPEFTYLPRKFKIAFCATEDDRAATLLHDIGVYLEKNEAGEIGFRIIAGGGQGRMPFVGQTVCEWLPKKHLMSYCEAILRVYNQQGRRDNKHRARIKVLVNSLGIEKFTELVEEEWAHLKDGPLTITDEEIARVQAFFKPGEYQTVNTAAFDTKKAEDAAFARWVERNTAAHKVDGYRIVNIALKMHGQPPGDATSDQMEAIADLAEKFSMDQLRVTHEQNLVLADVQVNDLYEVWQTLKKLGLAAPVMNTLVDMICCPGLDFCSLANAGSIDISKQIEDRFNDLDYLYDIGELKIKMSGCMNACGHHHVGHIGILGVDKKGVEWYQLTLGGSAANDAVIGDRLGRAIAKESVADAIEGLVQVYIKNRNEEERFIDTYRRIGIEPFQEKIYA